MKQYRIHHKNDVMYVECRDKKGNWYSCAKFDEYSRIIFLGDLPDEMCEEIYAFLDSKCINIDENGIAWVLNN